MGAFLLAHYRAALYAAAAAALIALQLRNNAQQRAIGAASGIIAQLAAEKRANALALRRVDTLYRRDTLRRIRTETRYVTLRDTLLEHKTDTVLVDRFVAIADSSRKVCAELEADCNSFRRLAYQRFDLYEGQIKALNARPSRGRCGLELTAGAAAIWHAGGIVGGPGATAGVGCRW